MKKFFIPLVLLFGFFVFVPQIAMGDGVFYLSPQQKREIEENNKKELNCLYEKKAKLPSEYFGTDIKPKEIIFGSGGFAFKNEDTNSKNLRRRLAWIYGGKWLTTNISYSINPEDNLSHEFYSANKYSVMSVVYKCTEYVVMRKKTIDMPYPGYLYDVTNVPLGSHLKYIPETHEMQIINPASKEYEQIIKEQMIPKKTLSEKAEEDFKKIPQNILIALCVCILTVIFLKNIFKKGKK